MPKATERDRTATVKVASASSDDDEFDRLCTDKKNVAQATRANQARQQSGGRRVADPATCERDYPAEELEFMRAMHDYKQASGRMFPTWSEVLEVLRALGYKKIVGDVFRSSQRHQTRC